MNVTQASPTVLFPRRIYWSPFVNVKEWPGPLWVVNQLIHLVENLSVSASVMKGFLIRQQPAISHLGMYLMQVELPILFVSTSEMTYVLGFFL